jgi:hypothetical protein
MLFTIWLPNGSSPFTTWPAYHLPSNHYHIFLG